jgi:hypothetical protein
MFSDLRLQTALSGIAAVALFGTGSAIWGLDMPDGGAPVGEITAFYRDTADRIVLGATLSIVALAAYVPFAAGLRRILADADGDDVLATEAFAGAVLVGATGLGAETINMAAALRAQDGELNDALAQSLFEISQILGSTASAIGLAVFCLAVAAVVLRTGALMPRWVGAGIGITGLVLLTPVSRINEVAGTCLVALTLVICLELLRGRPREPAPG